MKNRIDPIEVAKRYNSLDVIIDADDKWHLLTEKNICNFVHTTTKAIPSFENKKILNAGSAGNNLGLTEKNMIHVDVANRHIEHLPNSVVANIESMPFDNDFFDIIICVGSVLNYCDPIRVIEEFRRVLKKGGALIIEFENSKSFELIFKRGFNNSAYFTQTFFDAHGDKENIWYFSENYISRLLKKNGFSINKRKRFHILSPLIYRITGKETFSASFIFFDKIIKFFPIINSFSSNVILLCYLNKN